MAIAAAAPPRTNRIDRTRFARSPSTTPSIVPRIGVISGATIMAPMTVAVESPTTPAAAMIEARTNRTQNRLFLRFAWGSSKNTASRMRSRSVASTVGIVHIPVAIRHRTDSTARRPAPNPVCGSFPLARPNRILPQTSERSEPGRCEFRRDDSGVDVQVAVRSWAMPWRKNSTARPSGSATTSSSPYPMTAPNGAFQYSAAPGRAASHGPT